MFFAELTDNPLTLVGALVVGLGTLASVIGILWTYANGLNKTLMDKLNGFNARIDAELQECKEDRDKIWEELKQLQCRRCDTGGFQK